MACLPPWHYRILEVYAQTKRYGKWSVHGCPQAWNARTVPCKPENMRAKVEAAITTAGLWSGPLPLETYALARNIISEVGSPSDGATPEELVAIAEAAVNRRNYDPKRHPDILSQVTYKDSSGARWFGRQSGTNPAAASVQDPEFVHIWVAHQVLTGQIPQFAKGGSLYFDAVTQDAVRRKCLARGSTDCSMAASSVIKSWTADGDATWVGPLLGINPRRLMLFIHGKPSRTAYKTPAGKAHWAAMREAALAAIESTDPDERKTVYNLPPCAGAGPQNPGTRSVAGAMVAILGVTGAAFAVAYFSKVWKTTRYLPKPRRVGV